MTLRERLTTSVTDIRARGQRLAQLNLELLTSEVKEKGRKFAAAIGLFAAAGLFALYAVGFALATIAVALALVLPLWLSLLIVTVVLFALVAVLILVGRSQVRRIGNPAPEAAVAEARTTADMMRANLRETATGVRMRMGERPELVRWSRRTSAERSRGTPTGRRRPIPPGRSRRTFANRSRRQPAHQGRRSRPSERPSEIPMADTPGKPSAPKPAARPVSEIRADITRERAALTASFEALRGELNEALDEGQRRLDEARARARRIAPIAAGLAAVAAVALLTARWRARR